MKPAETPPFPRSAPGRPPETAPGHRALVVCRGGSKILATHMAKLAVVSIRQSSLPQVLENRESTARQYALRD